MKHKIEVANNFVWLIVNDKAKEILNTGLFELYILHDDATESLINDIGELQSALESGYYIGVEGDYLFNAKITTNIN